MCGRRLLQLLRVRLLLRVLSPCCVAAAVAERVTYGCVDICIIVKVYVALKLPGVASLLEVLRSISREAAAHSSSVRTITIRLIIRLILRFELSC